MARVTLNTKGNYGELVNIFQINIIIKTIENYYNIALKLCENTVEVVYNDSNDNIIGKVERTMNAFIELNRKKVTLDVNDMLYLISAVNEGTENKVVELFSDKIKIYGKGANAIYCKTVSQKIYFDTLQKNTVTFAVGAAGTGKSVVAIYDAVRRLKAKEYEKIILVRPAVEAGESLGFLPGTLQEKIDPYIMPLYDALNKALGVKVVQDMLVDGTIEIAPLAYMRGRTLDNAIVILDEAQNTTDKQMKMFLTRLGNNCKMIITGDITQIDLVSKVKSGLLTAMEILKNVSGIGIVKFSNSDVVRHPIVRAILQKYDTYECR